MTELRNNLRDCIADALANHNRSMSPCCVSAIMDAIDASGYIIRPSLESLLADHPELRAAFAEADRADG